MIHFILKHTEIRKEFQTLLQLALPLIATQLSQFAIIFTDTLMASWLGKEALAGGGLGAGVYAFILMVGMGLLMAVGNLVALNKKNLQEILGVTKAGLFIATCYGLFFSLLLWNIGPLLLLLGQKVEVVNNAVPYLRACMWGLLPALWFNTLRGTAVGLLHPGPIMGISLSAVIVNIGLNYLLMFGAFGFSGLGLVGSGIASALVSCLMCIALMIYMGKSNFFAAYPFFRQLGDFAPEQVRELLKLGIPTGLVFASEGGFFIAASFIVGSLGTLQLAAHQIVYQCISFSFMIPLGITHAVTITISQSYGEQETKHLLLMSRLSLFLGICWMSFTGLLFWIGGEQIATLFVASDEKDSLLLIQLAVQLLLVGACFQIFDGSQSIACGAMRGINENTKNLAITTTGYWIFGVPTAYLLGIVFQQGAVGVWIGLAVGLATTALLAVFSFERKIATWA